MSIALFLSNCGSSKKDVWDGKTKAQVLLPVDSIYDYSALNNAVKKIKPANRLAGSRFFLMALGTYRNKKNPQSSLGMFKQAISYYPSGRAYYELGNALLDLRVHEEAYNAYNMADELDYKPKFKLFYNQAFNMSLAGDSARALEYLRRALEGGYKNKANLLKDKDLNNIRYTEDFTILVTKYLSGKDVGKKAMFTLLENGFPKVNLPYSILDHPEKAYNDKKIINYDFADFIPGMQESSYSRDVEDEYSYTANLVMNDTFAVLAFSKMEVIADTLQPESTYLVSYDLNGKIIDTLQFAGRQSSKEFKIGIFNKNRQITLKEYKNTWRDDPDSKGYVGNAIVKTDLLDVKYYKLDNTGNFKKIQPEQADIGSR